MARVRDEGYVLLLLKFSSWDNYSSGQPIEPSTLLALAGPRIAQYNIDKDNIHAVLATMVKQGVIVACGPDDAHKITDQGRKWAEVNKGKFRED